jgi:hypothetical protein
MRVTSVLNLVILPTIQHFYLQGILNYTLTIKEKANLGE